MGYSVPSKDRIARGRRATITGASKWGTRRKSHEVKVKFKYNTRSPANKEKQVLLSFYFN